MCIRPFVTIVASACLLALCAGGGCNEQQLQRIDQAMADVNSAGDIATGVAGSPAGQALPVEIQLIMGILGIGASLAAAIWKHLRAQGLAVTAKTIIRAVEQMPADVQSQIKPEVERQMLREGVWAKANAIVDELKKS
jgi:hypothetical protein